MEYGVDYLGEDLLGEILSKLQVKSVLRCRSVSKSWCVITKSANFLTRHRSHHQPSDDDHRRMMLLDLRRANGYKPFNNHRIRFLMISDGVDTISSWRLPRLFVSDIKQYFVFGTCNGLVYVNMRYLSYDCCSKRVKEHIIIVWNPATEQYRMLLKPNIEDTSIPFSEDEKDDIVRKDIWDYNSVNTLLAFGFVDGEHKVARIFCHRDSDDQEEQLHVLEGRVFRAQVFVQSTNSWRDAKNELRVARLHYSFPDTSIMLNGALYWEAIRSNADGNSCVMSFDLIDEAFNVIDLPPPFQYMSCTTTRLFSFQNSLACSLCWETLWVMNNNREWTLKFNLGEGVLKTASEWLRFWKDDQFLFTSDLDRYGDEYHALQPNVPNDLISYDPFLLSFRFRQGFLPLTKHVSIHVGSAWKIEQKGYNGDIVIIE